MPIVFIHGVNTRAGRGYTKAKGIRRVLAREYLIPKLRQKWSDFPDDIAEVYWGDVGVKFYWNLASIPATRLLEALGAREEDFATEAALAQILAKSETLSPSSSRFETLGAPRPELLAQAARTDPQGTATALLARETVRAIDEVAPDIEDIAGDEIARVEREGELLGALLVAADRVARDPGVLAELRNASTDEDVLSTLSRRVEERHNQIVTPEVELEALGPISWIGDRVQDLRHGVLGLVNGGREVILRAATLAALARYRRTVNSGVAQFIGDVFEYQRRKGNINAIGESVKGQILDAIEQAKIRTADEPLILITHSFGAAILYDLVTSDEKLMSVPVDLWMTVGAQVSLFGEMRFFKEERTDIPGAGGDTLPRPPKVKRWVNVYDAADILSYIAKPVFGDGVEDVSFKEGANLFNAHGAYFLEPDFYRLVADSMDLS